LQIKQRAVPIKRTKLKMRNICARLWGIFKEPTGGKAKKKSGMR
jgi:hypothetical protein